MRQLSRGDIIVCVNPDPISIHGEGYKHGEEFVITYTRNGDLAIIDNDGYPHWFGQIGSTEPWDNWFVLKEQWDREQIINSLLQ